MAAVIASLAVSAAVAPAAHAYVYWATRGLATGTTIGRANLDGTGANSNFVSGATGPVGVAVNGSFIYWANTFGSHTTIGRANLDGTGVNQSFISAADYPCGVAVDGSYVYWANSGSSDTIGRAKLDGTGVNQSFISGADHPCGVAVDGAHVYWANEGTCGPSACGGTTIGRANLDGSAPNESFITGLSGPVGVAVNGSNIYWGNNDANTIGRANLDGTSPNNSFINGPGGCTDFPALDAGHIYWANDCDSSIGRANLDGTSINETFISVPSNPGGVAVDSLPITSPVVITGNPVSRTVTEGQPASFTASAAGTPTPTVQWQASINGVSFQNIPGATQTTLTIATASSGQSGDQFRAVFTNSAGSVTTAAAKLTVLPTAVRPPACTLAPQSARVFASTLARGANKAIKKPPKGVLTLTGRCNQAARVTLSGKIGAVLVAKRSPPHAGKGKRPKRKAFQISPLRASITAGKSLTLTVKLPAAALAALKAGARESAAFTLTATNTNGSSQATAKIRQLKLVQVRRK